MARAVETISAAPFAKFANLGDTLVGAFAGGKARQRQNFDTKQPLFKPDGKPSLEEVMYFVVMPGTTAVTGDVQGDNPSPLNEGDHVRFAVSGFKWGTVIDQRKQLVAHAGFRAGQPCSGDVYVIELTGWSAETKNAEAARKAGYTVVDGRVVIRSNDERDRFVLERTRANQPASLGKDYGITIRRPGPQDKAWEQAADELFDAKPWERQVAMAEAGATSSSDVDDVEPF